MLPSRTVPPPGSDDLPVVEFDPVPWHEREPKDAEEARIFQRNREYEMERAPSLFQREYSQLRPHAPVRPNWLHEDFIYNYALVMKEIPRQLHAMHREARQAALEAEPPWSGTQWDAMLAGICHRVAYTHGHAVPAWCFRKECFLPEPWVLVDEERRDITMATGTPAAFMTRNVFPGASVLDYRIGETEPWSDGALV